MVQNNNLLGGRTAAELVLTNVGLGDAAVYKVIITGLCGSPANASAQLSLNQPLAINFAPVSLTNCPGTLASFTVSAAGTSLSYQWFKNSALLTGQTAATLLLSNVTAGDVAVPRCHQLTESIKHSLMSRKSSLVRRIFKGY